MCAVVGGDKLEAISLGYKSGEVASGFENEAVICLMSDINAQVLNKKANGLFC